MALPPGVNQRDFDRALRAFEAAVGEEWVFTSAEDVALYRDAYSPFFGEEDERVASAAVAPESAEQVQAIVRIANELRESRPCAERLERNAQGSGDRES